MAQTIPYLVPLNHVFVGNDTFTLQYQTPQNQTLYIDEIVYISTGAFIIYDWRIQSSLRYTNASQTIGIKNTLLQAANSANLGIHILRAPIVVGPQLLLSIDLKDTSGVANTVDLLLNGRMDIP